MAWKGKRLDLGIRTNTINLAQFEILDAKILLRCSKGKALRSLRSTAVVVVVVRRWSAVLNPHLGIEFLLHFIHRQHYFPEIWISHYHHTLLHAKIEMIMCFLGFLTLGKAKERKMVGWLIFHSSQWKEGETKTVETKKYTHLILSKCYSFAFSLDTYLSDKATTHFKDTHKKLIILHFFLPSHFIFLWIKFFLLYIFSSFLFSLSCSVFFNKQYCIYKPHQEAWDWIIWRAMYW